MATWRKLLQKAVDETGDAYTETTLSEKDLDRKFSDGYGGSQGKPFTAWGDKYVYFPVVYDGAEWVGWAPRNPCDEPTRHQGGE